MVINVNKNDSQKEIDAAVLLFKKNKRKLKLADFYGKLKGKFGDGLGFQKNLRNEWD